MTCATATFEVTSGNDVTVSVLFTDKVSGNPVDPTTVEIAFGPEGGTATTWTYGVDSQVIRDSPGTFHADVPTSGGGAMWIGQWVGTGTHPATEKFEFYVRALPWPAG